MRAPLRALVPALALAAGCTAAPVVTFQRARLILEEPGTEGQPGRRLALVNESHPDYRPQPEGSAGFDRLYRERGLKILSDEAMARVVARCEEADFWRHARPVDDPYETMIVLARSGGYCRGYVTLEVDDRRGTVMRSIPPELRGTERAPGTALDWRVAATLAMADLARDVAHLANESPGRDIATQDPFAALEPPGGATFAGGSPTARPGGASPPGDPFLSGARVETGAGAGDPAFGRPAPDLSARPPRAGSSPRPAPAAPGPAAPAPSGATPSFREE